MLFKKTEEALSVSVQGIVQTRAMTKTRSFEIPSWVYDETELRTGERAWPFKRTSNSSSLLNFMER